MKPKIIFAIATVTLIIAAAGVLRWHDAPYIAYVKGDRRTAVDGLRIKADNGDGFAAFLAGKYYDTEPPPNGNSHTAAKLYLKSARAGEIRAVSAYLALVLERHANLANCTAALPLLEAAGRAGEINALVMLGRLYGSGICGEADIVRAEGYYRAAESIDGRIREIKPQTVELIDPDIAASIQPTPSEFDLSEKDALSLFLASAPILAD